MGTEALLSSQLPQRLGLTFPDSISKLFLLTGAKSGDLADTLGPLLAARESAETETAVEPDASGDIESQFEALVYSSKVSRVSLQAAFQQAAATTSGDDDSGVTEFAAQQLTFKFLAESRTEELIAFRERTAAVADGLEGAQQGSYVEASRVVAQRFSVSLTITGAALSGYSKASEAAAAGGSTDFDKFLEFANDTLKKADEVLQKIFELLDGFFANDTSDFEAQFNELLGQLQSIGFNGSQSTGDSQGQTGTQTLQAFGFSFQLEFEFESIEVTQQGQVQKSDPIVFDLDGDGVELTSYTNGARFDITGSGQTATTAFVTGGDAFLALDRNTNGKIDNGLELFGDQRGAANGFEELRKLDSNTDGVINDKDKDFDKLVLFKDDGDGVTEDGELVSLAQAGISEINLGYRNVDQSATGGNRLAQIASYRYTDGRQGKAVDALLNYTI